jgi:hypothetical protein
MNILAVFVSNINALIIQPNIVQKKNHRRHEIRSVKTTSESTNSSE